jgi:hypothetical protein
MKKYQLEILFRRCGLKGDTARILQKELISRIERCHFQLVAAAMLDMVSTGDIMVNGDWRPPSPISCVESTALTTMIGGQAPPSDDSIRLLIMSLSNSIAPSKGVNHADMHTMVRGYSFSVHISIRPYEGEDK